MRDKEKYILVNFASETGWRRWLGCEQLNIFDSCRRWRVQIRFFRGWGRFDVNSDA